MGKRYLAIIGGILFGAIVIALMEMVLHARHPLPEDVDKNDMQALGEFIRQLPPMALWGLIFGWGLGSMSAGWLAAKITPVSPKYHSLIAGAGLMIMTILNLVQIPHPGWMWIPGILIHLPCAWVGYKLSGKREE